MNNFEYIYPKNAESIPALLSDAKDQTLLFAGGTDAIARLKEGISKPQQLVNLKAVKDLNYVKADSDGLHIGATTLLSDLINNDNAQKYAGLLEAANSIGSLQLRNMGTVGGNLCQRPRCWYFRSRHFPCLRKQGEQCFSIYGENKYHCILGGNPCFIVNSSDLAPMLIALNAKVTILGPDGSRQIPLEDLYVLPEQDPYHETILTTREVITDVTIPNNSGKSHYLKFKERQSMDFALVSVAIAAKVNGKTLSDIRIALGGVAPKPWRAKKAENMLEGQEASESLVEKAAESELLEADPLDHNEYKVILTKNLLKKTVRELVAA